MSDRKIPIPLHGAIDNTSLAMLPAQSPLDMIMYPRDAASKRQIDDSFSENISISKSLSKLQDSACLASHSLPEDFSNISRMTKFYC